MSVAGIPVTLNQDFMITVASPTKICVGPANVNAVSPFKQVCYEPMVGIPVQQALLAMKYSALSYLVFAEMLAWSMQYEAKYPSGPKPTDDQQKQVVDLIFQQLPLKQVAPLEDNGAAWTVGVFNSALMKIGIPGFKPIPTEEFAATFQVMINKYLGGGGGGGGGGGNTDKKWLGMPMWFWVVLLVLFVLGALSMYMKRGGNNSTESELF